MLQRSFNRLSDVSVNGDGRTITLAVVPFHTPTWVCDDGTTRYREAFLRGAFKHVVKAPQHVELRYNHTGGLPYGFGITLTEEPDYLIGEFRVAPGDQGDQVLALVNDDQLRGVSVGYIPGQSRDARDDDGPLVERMRVKRLVECSLTTAPSYPDTGVLAVRSEPDFDAVAERERERLHWFRVRAGLL